MNRTLRSDEPLAIAVGEAIRGGDVEELERLLRDDSGLASASIRDDDSGDGASRTLLHVATDWPGHFPNVAATIDALIHAGAEVDARNAPGTETALHWAASSDDVEALDALVEGGADIEASGAAIAGGTPLDDAVGFGQWRAARRLVDHGARTALWHSAALGLIDRVEAHVAGGSRPAAYSWEAGSASPPDEVTVALWCACHGGQRQTAEYLAEQGGDINWVSDWDGLTPLDAARREGAEDLVAWLRTRGAKAADELTTAPGEEER